jgi:hypothetical protein
MTEPDSRPLPTHTVTLVTKDAVRLERDLGSALRGDGLGGVALGPIATVQTRSGFQVEYRAVLSVAAESREAVVVALANTFGDSVRAE